MATPGHDRDRLIGLYGWLRLRGWQTEVFLGGDVVRTGSGFYSGLIASVPIASVPIAPGAVGSASD